MDEFCILEEFPLIVFRKMAEYLEARDFFRLRRCSKTIEDICIRSNYKPSWNALEFNVKQASTSNALSDQAANEYTVATRNDVNVPFSEIEKQKVGEIHVVFLNVNFERPSLLNLPAVYEDIRENWMDLIAVLSRYKVTAHRLNMHSFYQLSPEVFQELIKTVKSQVIVSGYYPNSREKTTYEKCLSLPEFRDARQLGLVGGAETSDRLLLSWKSPKISLFTFGITEQGLNTFLKQYLRGEREIDTFYISTVHPDHPLHFFNRQEILNGIEVNTIWTSADHGHSIISRFPIEEIRVPWTGHGEIFAIWRPGEYLNPLILDLHSCYLTFETLDDDMTEDDYVYKLLTTEQKEALLNPQVQEPVNSVND